MTRSHPPALATRLLQQFIGPDRQAIIGDLIERYADGRSRSWYWRQVVTAIIRSTLTDVRGHLGSALCGVALGWISFYAFVSVLGLVQTQLMIGSLINIKLWWWQHGGPSLDLPLGVAWLTFGAIAAGWLIARTQRSHWNGSILIYLASYFLVELVLAVSIAVAVYRDPHVYGFSERLYLFVHVPMVFVLWPAGVLLGGLVAERKQLLVEPLI